MKVVSFSACPAAYFFFVAVFYLTLLCSKIWSSPVPFLLTSKTYKVLPVADEGSEKYKFLQLVVRRESSLEDVTFISPIPVSRGVRRVCGLSPAGSAGSNPAEGSDVSRSCFLSNVGLCDWPIPRPEKSYRVFCVWVWSRNFNDKEA
jgi:hypothetical protein